MVLSDVIDVPRKGNVEILERDAQKRKGNEACGQES
jgi:hypothetical protein